MPKLKSTKREYDSSRRQAQAKETRRHILEAARKLFIERGYAGATAEAIAAEAGVSAQTIYAIFKNKKKILVSLMNVSPATGVEDHTPMSERANVQAVAQERDQRRQLQMFAQVVAGNLNQVADVFEVITEGAKIEPDFERIVQKLNKQRLENMTFAVQQFASHGPFRDGISFEYARDTVWTLTSGEVFLLLTRDRGWSKENYAEWLADMLIRALLP
jgi:TetR/AcrR family transcriptional regulator, regulator of autoinduction and epiphytic fitness